MYENGDQLGQLGVYALAAAALLAGLVLWRRTRSPLVPLGAVVLAAACYPFLTDHVFPPRAVLALVGGAVDPALLEASRARTH